MAARRKKASCRCCPVYYFVYFDFMPVVLEYWK